jgi:hypothetical protein
MSLQCYLVNGVGHKGLWQVLHSTFQMPIEYVDKNTLTGPSIPSKLGLKLGWGLNFGNFQAILIL